MKFIDLNEQYQLIKDRIQGRMQTVLDHGQFIGGPEILELENELKKYVGVQHCISASSGTTALQLALMALKIGPGDEVITSAFSFFATAGTIMLLGATPIFVDIEPDTFNLNPDLLVQAITPRTKAIMPVSLYGQCADIDAINAIAKTYGLAVIEDAAQSFGAQYKKQFSCGVTTIGCTSFFPSKSLGCYGDGGACFTNDDELANAMRNIANHGQEKRYYHTQVGINGRMDSLQAAIVLEKLVIFKEELERRQQVAAWYEKLLENQITLPKIAAYNSSSYAQFTIRLQGRDELAVYLAQQEIPTAVHYPRTLYQQPAAAHLQPSIPCLEAEAAAREVLSLPFHPYMSYQDVEKICGEILKWKETTIPLCEEMNA